ncbi:meiosis regulator and mRNA stability factor 1-like [Ptychodera flava]|uniref:meiosis regulator and mRNA stability factor 1-like n=1 Tax=Ptychodera flava TaxID=63121 RepID=UPI00396A93A3
MSRLEGKGNESSDDSGESRYHESAVDGLQKKKRNYRTHERFSPSNRDQDSPHHHHHYLRDGKPFRHHRSASPRESHDYRQGSPHYRGGSSRFRSCSPRTSSPRLNKVSHSSRYHSSHYQGSMVYSSGTDYRNSRDSPHDYIASSENHGSGTSLYESGTHPARTRHRQRSRSPEESSHSSREDTTDKDSCESHQSKTSDKNHSDTEKRESKNTAELHDVSDKRKENPPYKPTSTQPEIPIHSMYNPMLYHSYPEHNTLPQSGLWAPVHHSTVTPLYPPIMYGYQQPVPGVQQMNGVNSGVQYPTNQDLSNQLLSVLQSNMTTVQQSFSFPGVAVQGQAVPSSRVTTQVTGGPLLPSQIAPQNTGGVDSQKLLALLQEQTQQAASSRHSSQPSSANSSPIRRLQRQFPGQSPMHHTGSQSLGQSPVHQSKGPIVGDPDWRAATQCLPSSQDRKTPPTQEQCIAAAVQAALAKSETSSSCTVSSESLPAIGVFWDIENCPVPNSKSALAVVQKIRERFFQGHREAEFMCVCDINKENSQVIQELNDAQVTVAHINATAKNAADDKLRQSLRRFSDTHSVPSTVVLISGDVNFANDLSDLRHRHNFKVILIHRPEVAEALLACAHEHVCYTDILNEVPFRSPVKSVSESVELLVSNLPMGKEYGQLRNRLRQLSDNCGGRVNITGSTAIVKFPTSDSAMRAQKRMDGEDVYGSKITVSFANKFKCGHQALKYSERRGFRSPDRKDKKNTGTPEETLPVPINGDGLTPEKPCRGALMIQQQLYQEKQEHMHSEQKCKDPDTNRRRNRFYHHANGDMQEAKSPKIPDDDDGKATHNSGAFSKAKQDDYHHGQRAQSMPELDRRYSPYDSIHGNARYKQSSPLSPLYGPMMSSWKVSPVFNLPGGIHIPQYPNGIEILVENLDEKLPKRELRRILLSVFREQCKVLQITFMSTGDGPLQAVVRVPRMADAHLAVAHINRHRIGNKRVHVTLAPNPNSNLDYLRNQVVTMLSDVEGGSLPLYKFEEIYEIRFKRPLHVSDLFQIPDTVVMQDTPSGRVVALTYYACKADKIPQLTVGSRNSPIIISPIPSREPTPEPCEEYCSVHDKQSENQYRTREEKENPCVVVSLKTFSAQVHTLLQIHDGRLPLISFPICYAAEFRPLEVDENSGVPVEHLLTCIQGVRVAVSKDSFKTVCWTQNTLRPPTPVPGGVLRSPSPILTPQLFQFSKEVIELMKSSPHCRMSFSKFIPAYHHHFGRQCRVAEYGFTKLIELFDAIPHIVQVMGVYGTKTLTLTHRSQVKRFTQDILKVLKSQASKQVSVVDFPSAYGRCFGRSWEVTDYGVCDLHDLLPEIPDNTVMISGLGDDTVISIPKRDQTDEERIKTKKFAKEVTDLLKHQPRFRLAFPKFIPAYHHHFGRQCRVADYGFNKLMELFEAISDNVEVVDQGDEKVVSLTAAEQMSVIAKQIIHILKRSKQQSLPLCEFLSTYTKQYGHPICLDDFNVESVSHLMAKLPCVIQVIGQGDQATICLIDRTCLQEFAHQTLVLLMEEEHGQLSIDQFSDAFYAVWGHRVVPAEYGYSKLTELLKAISNVAKVRNEWTENCHVELIPLHQFARKVRLLLRKHHGAIPFMKFADAYYQEFGTTLQASQYGCSNLSALLALVPHVVSIAGRGQAKTVTLNPDLKARATKRPVIKQINVGRKDSKEEDHDDVIIEGEVEEKSESGGSQQPSPTDDTNKTLLDLSSPNQSPEDLLCNGPVPACVPSPGLKPVSVPSQERDLICFDSPPPSADLNGRIRDSHATPAELSLLDTNDDGIFGALPGESQSGLSLSDSLFQDLPQFQTAVSSGVYGATDIVNSTERAQSATVDKDLLCNASSDTTRLDSPARHRSKGQSKPSHRNKPKLKLAANFSLSLQQ